MLPTLTFDTRGRTFITCLEPSFRVAQEDLREKIYSLERDVKRLEERIGKLTVQLKEQGDLLTSFAGDMDIRHQREEVLMAALGIEPSSEVGERGSLEDIDDSILRLEDYLLAMGERVQRILEMLQGHKEFLDKVNESIVRSGTRERMGLELDIMMNSISILVMAGIEIDPSIAAELEALRKSVRDSNVDIEGLRSRKRLLQERLQGEIKRYDLEQLFSKKKQIPGYG